MHPTSFARLNRRIQETTINPSYFSNYMLNSDSEFLQNYYRTKGAEKTAHAYSISLYYSSKQTYQKHINIGFYLNRDLQNRQSFFGPTINNGKGITFKTGAKTPYKPPVLKIGQGPLSACDSRIWISGYYWTDTNNSEFVRINECYGESGNFTIEDVRWGVIFFNIANTGPTPIKLTTIAYRGYKTVGNAELGPRQQQFGSSYPSVYSKICYKWTPSWTVIDDEIVPNEYPTEDCPDEGGGNGGGGNGGGGGDNNISSSSSSEDWSSWNWLYT